MSKEETLTLPGDMGKKCFRARLPQKGVWFELGPTGSVGFCLANKTMKGSF